MMRCKCGKIYDTDFQMEVDENGDCICDECYQSRPLKCEVEDMQKIVDANEKLVKELKDVKD